MFCRGEYLGFDEVFLSINTPVFVVQQKAWVRAVVALAFGRKNTVESSLLLPPTVNKHVKFTKGYLLRQNAAIRLNFYHLCGHLDSLVV